MGLLTNPQIQHFASAHPEWTVGDGAIRRTLVFPDFGAAIGFVVRVALLAEKANHHPDIDVRWNRVSLALTSHDAVGLTDRDVTLAERIEGLVADT